MKKLLLLIIFSQIMFFGVALAQTGGQNYELLEPIPYVTTDGKTTDVQTYIPGVVKLVIGAAGALAVIMIIIGGIQYMSTDAIGKKDGAKHTIQNAVWGFVLVLSSWLILATINPSLTSIDLTLDAPKAGSDISANPTEYASTTDRQINGTAWNDDSSWRTTITSAPLNMSINKTNCTTIGQSNCTSVYDLKTSIITALRSIRNGCRNCTIQITGGTEYWLHGNTRLSISANNTLHKPAAAGGRALDFHADAVFSQYIKTAGRLLNQYTRQCGDGTTRSTYDLNGAYFTINDCSEVSTGPHWHAVFP